MRKNGMPCKKIPGRRAALLGLLGLSTLLGACSSLLGSQPQLPLTVYALDRDAPPGGPLAVRPGQRVLLLQPPEAAPGYDSTRMVYQRQPQTLEAYTQSAWVDTPARMLAPLLRRTLQDSGLFRAVVQAPGAAQADLRLDTQILRLQQNFLQHPSGVRFTLQATLTDQRTRQVLAWKVWDVTQAAGSDDAAGGAEAAGTAVQTALQQLLLFVQSNVAALRPLASGGGAP